MLDMLSRLANTYPDPVFKVVTKPQREAELRKQVEELTNKLEVQYMIRDTYQTKLNDERMGTRKLVDQNQRLLDMLVSFKIEREELLLTFAGFVSQVQDTLEEVGTAIDELMVDELD